MGVIWTPKDRERLSGLRLSTEWLSRGLSSVYLPGLVITRGSARGYAHATRVSSGLSLARCDSGVGISPYGNNTFFIVANVSATSADCVAFGRVLYTGGANYGAGLRFNGAHLEINQANGSWAYSVANNQVSTGINSYAGVCRLNDQAQLFKNAQACTIDGGNVGLSGAAIPVDGSMNIGQSDAVGMTAVTDALVGSVEFGAHFVSALTAREIAELHRDFWQLLEADNDPVFYSLGGGGANTTATLSSTLDATTLTGVGAVTRSGALTVTLDAATLAGIGGVATSGTLAVTLDAATLTGIGAVTTSGALSSTLEDATLAGVGSVAVGTNRDGTLAVTLDAATLAGIGAVTTSGTLAVTLDAATLAGIGTAGQAITGTLAVTLDNATLSGVGAIPAAPSTGGGKTTGKNLSRKQKKKLKAVESQEWLKAEETARQLLSDRFTKQTPQEKAQALETHIESLTPVIEALKALTSQIEDVQETVQETKTEELTEHKQILNKFDALITKMTSIEELLIIMLAQ